MEEQAGPVPGDFEELKQQLALRQARLSKRLRQVAAFALAHPDEIALGTVMEIAARADVQPSTLVRFAKSFGFSGFSEMQRLFRSRLRSNWPTYAERLAGIKASGPDAGAPETLLGGFARAARASIDRLEQEHDAGALDRAVKLLAGARTIHLLGQRRAFAVASYLAYAFGKLGVPVQLMDNVGSLLPEQATAIHLDDAVIAISFAPYTPGTLEMAERAAAAGVPVIALSDGPLSPLAGSAQVSIEVAEADFAAFRSLSATLCLATTLAVAVAEAKG
jgi:DNA-binding MurR/RpiR family transcriptional regulator